MTYLLIIYLALKTTDIPRGISNNKMINNSVTISLNQNYPNLFNPTTTIFFSTTENTELVIYNMKG